MNKQLEKLLVEEVSQKVSSSETSVLNEMILKHTLFPVDIKNPRKLLKRLKRRVLIKALLDNK